MVFWQSFFSLPLPEYAGKLIIFIDKMIFPLAFIGPVGYYLLQDSERTKKDFKGTPGQKTLIALTSFLLTVLILGHKLVLTFLDKGTWAFMNIPILIFSCAFVMFAFRPFYYGLAWVGFAILLDEKPVEAVSEEKCSAESFYSSEYNSAGKMPN